MAKEFETKVIGIDPNIEKEKLIKLAAKHEGDFLMKRWVFDIDPINEEWIRVRDDGRKITLTYKKRFGTGISEVKELETEIKDFDIMAEICKKITSHKKYYQENKRSIYKLDNIEITFDTWPKLDTYMEIEGISEQDVLEITKKLDLLDKHIGNVSVKDLYSENGIDLHSFEILKF